MTSYYHRCDRNIVCSLAMAPLEIKTPVQLLMWTFYFWRCSFHVGFLSCHERSTRSLSFCCSLSLSLLHLLYVMWICFVSVTGCSLVGPFHRLNLKLWSATESKKLSVIVEMAGHQLFPWNLPSAFRVFIMLVCLRHSCYGMEPI